MAKPAILYQSQQTSGTIVAVTNDRFLEYFYIALFNFSASKIKIFAILNYETCPGCGCTPAGVSRSLTGWTLACQDLPLGREPLGGGYLYGQKYIIQIICIMYFWYGI